MVYIENFLTSFIQFHDRLFSLSPIMRKRDSERNGCKAMDIKKAVIFQTA